MKKIFLFIFAAVMTVSFISCINEYELTIEESYGPITYIGTKKPSEAKAVGDIVFSDRSATPYSDTLTLTDDQKNAAVAVIYKVDGSHSYGVGLVQATGKIWCATTAKGYNKIDDIVCTPISAALNTYTFGNDADTNGSDNLTKIGEATLSPARTDDTGTEGNYPAFYFAKNYKDQTNSHVSGTRYENNWYLPSISELYDIYNARNNISSAIVLCNGNSFMNACYWSSSQISSSEDSAYIFSFQNGEITSDLKSSSANVTLCIRQF